jgi:rhodanese-related sulfurtransferase
MKVYTLMMIVLLIAGAAACQNQDASGQPGASETTQVDEAPVKVLKVLSPGEFAAKKEGDIQLVDVRRPEEYAQGHIEGAVNYNFLGPDFNDEVAQLAKDKPVLLYCRTGRRSAAASKKLQGMGFKEIYDLQGGYLNWVKTQGGQ